MATSVQTIENLFTGAGNTQITTAQIVDWATRFEAGLLAVGLVQTADTGQAVPANFTAQSATAVTTLGYQVYRLPTGPQNTAAPIFIRVEYLQVQSAATNPGRHLSCTFRVGRSTDGAGTITGTVVVRTFHVTSFNAASLQTYHRTGVNPWYFSASSSHLSIAMTLNGYSTGQGHFLLERTVDAGGNADSAGWCVTSSTSSTQNTTVAASVPQHTGYNAVTQTAFSQVISMYPVINLTTGSSDGTNFYCTPQQARIPNMAGTLIGSVCYFAAEIAPETIFSVSLYGTPHSYIALLPGNGINAANVTSMDLTGRFTTAIRHD